MNIDHHLQLSLLRRLADSDTPVRYSDLKEGDVENSLFSYHLNKLLDRGMVEKRGDGYVLSTEGARWLNDNGLALRRTAAPRVFMALVVQNDTGDYLIGQRTGQFKATINDYMLPSYAYTNDEDLPNQIDATIATFIPAAKLTKRADFGFVQIKPTYADGRVMRLLFHVTYCETDIFETNKVNFEWMSREQINAIDHPSARILQGLIEHVRDSRSDGSTPVIVG